MLVSVHLPKTAGMSFRAALEDHFGDRFLPDYGDRPMNTTALRRNSYASKEAVRIRLAKRPDADCVHGHFMPLKYRFLRDTQFVAWLRDPVERLGSQYHYWRRSYNPQTPSVMQRRMVEEDWSLERLCLGPEFRNFYQRYFWGFPLKRFAYLGITEFFDEDIQEFSQRFLGAPQQAPQVNRNPEAPKTYFEDPDLRRRIESYHAVDFGIYRQALQMRAARRS